MAISNVSNTNPLASTRSAATTGSEQVASKNQIPEDRQPATIVTLSAQSKKLSMEETSITHTQSQPQTRANQTQSASQSDRAAVNKVEISAREAADAPVKRQLEEILEKKRINTYA